MKIAITGGTGCLGQPLIKKLISDEIEIQLMTLPQDPFKKKIEKKVHIIHGDLNSLEALKLLTKDSDIVFHLAGKVHSDPKTKAEEQEIFQVNVEGTKNLLKASKYNEVKKVVFYSTMGVYGPDADFHGDELSPCRPLSIYAKSKYMAEQLVLDSFKKEGPEGVVLRFPVVYGPFDRGNVARLINAVYKKLFLYFGDGSCLRSMVSSKNAAEAAIRAAFEPKAANQVFCVTDGRDHTMNELVGSICHALKISQRPYHVPVLLADIAGKFGDFLGKWTSVPFPVDSGKVRKLSRPLTFSCEKAKKVFGYEPVDTLEKGIRREVEWLYPEIRSTDKANYRD